MRLHPLPAFTEEIESPSCFTFPFCYEPHLLSVAAADEVRLFLASQGQWKEELQAGKMMGVLVVQHQGSRCFLAAFSGTLGGQTQHDYFVPPVFDLMAPGCHFQDEEERISQINRKITELTARIKPNALQAEMQASLAIMKEQMQRAKAERAALRSRLSAEALAVEEPTLVRESQYQKAEYRRQQQQWKKRVEETEAENNILRTQIRLLQAERQQRSQELQQWLFNQVSFLNAKGEEKNLLQVFHPFAPPSGAGDCCAPKLLQYAYSEGLQPICMAEFWVGASPKDELRTEGNYYPSCRSKCKPILGHMLQGLQVEDNPLLQQHEALVDLCKVLYSDADMVVVSKPSGMLSVPGKDDLPNVADTMKTRFPESTGPMVVHRLDMDTSGLMALALTEEAYSRLQTLFLHRLVSKTYLALLQKPMAEGEQGEIALPLAPDYEDRPRQKVDRRHGKPALTHYRVLDNLNGHALVALYPVTGRTHQLRVHCAHLEGLHNPIVGDRLYGHPAERLMLHAVRLSFENKEFQDPKVFGFENIIEEYGL